MIDRRGYIGGKCNRQEVEVKRRNFMVVQCKWVKLGVFCLIGVYFGKILVVLGFLWVC